MKNKILKFIELINLIRETKSQLKQLEEEILDYYAPGYYKVNENTMMIIEQHSDRKVVSFKELKSI